VRQEWQFQGWLLLWLALAAFLAVLVGPYFITQKGKRAAPASPTTSTLLWDQLDGN